MPAQMCVGRSQKLLGVLAALVAVTVVFPTSAAPQERENLPIDLPNGPAKAGFDISRFSNAGNGWFETFYVQKTESLRDALKAEKVAEDTRILVTETKAGNLALLMDQMAYHHLAEGRAGGKDWLATF